MHAHNKKGDAIAAVGHARRVCAAAYGYARGARRRTHTPNTLSRKGASLQEPIHNTRHMVGGMINPAQQVSPRDSYKRGRGVWGGAHCTQQHMHTQTACNTHHHHHHHPCTPLPPSVTCTQMARRRAHIKRLRRRLRRPPRRSQLAGRQRPCGSQRTGTARLSTPPTQRRRPAD